MIETPVYLLMISYKRESYALSILDNFLSAKLPVQNTKFIVLENSPIPQLNFLFDFKNHENIIYKYYPNKNKATAINYAIREIIEEQEAFVICIDNDVSFKKDYLLKFYEAAQINGKQYYYGTSFFVKSPKNLNKKLIPYLSGSALGQPDLQFKKMKNLMFLGFSYAFFKSQWEKVFGLDERFSPGSTYNLAAEESIFQKKLKYSGFKPFFVENNSVEHKPEIDLYELESVLFRQEQNGYTHAFQNIIISNERLKLDYFKQLAGLTKRCLTLLLQKDKLKYNMKFAYTKGYFRGFLLYLKIDDKKTYLNFKN